jgi:putative transposase
VKQNNRVENFHLVIRRREPKQQIFRSQVQPSVCAPAHGPIYNTFNLPPHLIRRSTLRQFRAAAQDAWVATPIAA